MLRIENLKGKYYINIDKLIEFVSNIDPNERLTNSVITETYAENSEGEPDDMVMVSKEIVETKGTGGGNEFFHDMRFRLINNLLESLTKTYTTDGEFYLDDDDETMSVSQKLAFNTLTKYGILVREE